MGKNHCAKHILSFLAAWLLLPILFPAAVRAEAYDPDKKGSITIQLQDLGTPMEGVAFCCYQVGRQGNDVQLSWEPVTELQGSGVDFNALKNAGDLQAASLKLKNEVVEKGMAGMEASTDATGNVRFTDLEQGMYLLVQTTTAQYGQCEPFLAAVPSSGEGVLWIYDVEADAKGQLLSTPTPLPVTGQTETPVPTSIASPAPVYSPAPVPEETPLPGILPQTGDGSSPWLWGGAGRYGGFELSGYADCQTADRQEVTDILLRRQTVPPKSKELGPSAENAFCRRAL